MYLIRSVSSTLRVLGDIPPARRDLRELVFGAKSLAISLDRLAQAQSFPGGEEVVAKGQLSKATDRHWVQATRNAAFKDLFEKEILTEFVKLDGECRGRGRFHIVLTYVEG